MSKNLPQSKNKNVFKAPYHRFIKTLLRDTHKLKATKSMVAMGILSIPFIIGGYGFIGVCLALGALAGSLAETDDHPRGRIKTIGLTVLSYAFSSIFVEVLYDYTIFFAIPLVLITILLILTGGIGERYRGVSFGALLIVIYAMLGKSISPAPYYQPILLTGGNLFYGLLSLALLYRNPWRPLEEQLANGFQALSDYLHMKAKLFPSDEKEQTIIRNQLALLNVRVINSLETCKEVLNSYVDAQADQKEIEPFLRKFILLQGLHERAISSHQRYDILSNDAPHRELVDGFGQVIKQLAHACHQVADRLLTGRKYRHSVSLNWTLSALQDQIEKRPEAIERAFGMLLYNLQQSNQALFHLADPTQKTLLPRLRRDERTLWERFKSQFNFDHPRMRYAIRLSSCFLIGYLMVLQINMEKSEWILLTSLFVCQPSYSETRRKLFQRILGTLSGVIIGVVAIRLLPTMAGEIILLQISAYAFFYWNKTNYAISVIFITLFVLAAFNLISGHGLLLMWPRLLDTLIGAALAIIMVRVLWPEWQVKKLPALLKEALYRNTNYFAAILHGYDEGEVEDDLDYRIARREAHKADNAVVMAWRFMQLEPKNQRRYQQQSFAMTYLNHALLSYLSALGAHRTNRDQFGTEVREVAQMAYEQLQCAAQTLDGEVTPCKKENLNNITLINHIKEMQESAFGIQRQQLILLYNIAEVTGQLLALSNEVVVLRGKKK